MRVIVTGAASGIGAAVARGLIAGRVMPGPHHVLLVDRDAEGLTRIAAELGGTATSFVTDIADPDCGAAIATRAVETMGGIDGLASNAGIIIGAPLATMDVADFDRMIAINTRATWLIAKSVYPHLVAAGGGSIVATGSISASHPTPPLGAYSASKAALMMLVRQMANEWGPDGIRCNTVSPGPTLTPMTAGGYADEERRRRREAGLPLRRLGAPEDIANVILFLLSDLSRNVTGVDLLADGGLATTLMTASGAGSGQTSTG